MKVIKRDGREVLFDSNKITSAILKAMTYGSGIIKKDIANKVGELIEGDIINEVIPPTVQAIESRVYYVLISLGEDVTAKSYEGYRAVQEYKRFTHPLDESILGLVDNTNEEVMTENSNKQATLASTQRDLIAGEVSKYISMTKKIPSYIIQAHNEGIIKIQDLDYFLQPISNCELVPLKDLFAKGTVINKQLIETPKSLQTAMTIATQVAAQVASFTYGGQTMSISHLAPFVRVSLGKIKEEIKEEGIENNINYTEKQINGIAKKRLKKEIESGVQTFNYQLNTMNGTNGQNGCLQ